MHWCFGGLFLLLLATGLALFHPQWRNWNLGGLKLLKEIHLTLGLLWVLLPLTAAAWDSGRSLRHNVAHLGRWGQDDWVWWQTVVGRLVGRRGAWPPVGRYNAGQKLNTVYVVVLGAGLALTGGLIWPDRLLDPVIRALIFSLHDLLMLLSLPALVGHLILTMIWPSTRPSLGSMLHGWLPNDWYSNHYPADPGPPDDSAPGAADSLPHAAGRIRPE